PLLRIHRTRKHSYCRSIVLTNMGVFLPMKKTSRAALSKLLKAEWFFAVGEPAANDVIVISSWDEAVRSCLADHWINTITRAANLMREEINSVSPKRMDKWDEVVDEIYEAARPRVHTKLEETIRRSGFP